MNMTQITTILQAAADIITALGLLAFAISHLPFLSAATAERFARFATYTTQSFSVNKRPP